MTIVESFEKKVSKSRKKKKRIRMINMNRKRILSLFEKATLKPIKENFNKMVTVFPIDTNL